MKVPKTSILISFFAHAVLLFLIIWSGNLFLKGYESGGSGGGGGSVVTVWVTGPSGDAFPAAPIEKTRLPTGAKTYPPQIEEGRKRAFDGAKSAGSGDGAGKAAGGGIGGGSGEGSGAGSGGDPILAKIWRRIDDRKYYPAIAKKSGLEGTPRITFELTENGRIKWVRLTESCGREILDSAAIETVKRAAPLPYYPHPITLAVRYSISD